MAESKLVKDLHNDFLKCAICMQCYKNPRMLPCIHSFCLQCLDQLNSSLNDQPFSCPTCRRLVTLPENGVNDLPKNFLLVSLSERLKMTDTKTGSKTAMCQFCQDIKNIQLCLDCNVHVCLTCKKLHDRIAGTDDHTVILTSKLADKKYMKHIFAIHAPRCSEHTNEELRFYCTSCSKLLCRDCTIIGHRGHECIEAKKRFDIVKQHLRIALRSSEDQIKGICKMDEKVTSATNRIEKAASSLKRKIDENYDKSVKKLNRDRVTSHQQVEQKQRKDCDPLKKVKGEVNNLMKAIWNTRRVTKEMLETNNQWCILEAEKSITDAFNKYREDEEALQEKQGQLDSNDVDGGDGDDEVDENGYENDTNSEDDCDDAIAYPGPGFRRLQTRSVAYYRNVFYEDGGLQFIMSQHR